MSNRRKSSSISSVTSLSFDTSPRYGFQPLLEPLPSPGLPSLVPRHGKKIPSSRYRTALSALIWLCGLGIFVRFALIFLQSAKSVDVIHYLSQDDAIFEVASDGSLPREPSPVVVTDKKGRLKWTILIPPALAFPLKPSQYTHICLQSDKVATSVAESKRRGASHGHAADYGYYHNDRNFMDMEEAQEHGLLPITQGKQAKWNSQSRGGQGGEDSMSKDLDTMQGGNQGNVCKRSLTYVMEATDAGFGETLMGLWMSYGLAKKEGRAFFIDDTNWAYGNYITYFQPPPAPSCLAPLPTHRVPCPHQAEHLIVSAATVSWTFGHSFNEQFQDAHKVEVLRQKPIFALLRTGYEALFHLNTQDDAYVSKRSQELNTIRDKGGLVVGVHVRHGDRHPWEFQYQKSYIPLEKYLCAANEFISSSSGQGDTSGLKNSTKEAASRIIVGSDDPMVYLSEEFSPALRAQTQMQLASKAALDAASAGSPTPKSNKFVEENVGWEGGFFQDMFWDLGIPSDTSKAAQLLRLGDSNGGGNNDVPELAMQLRALVGKTYMLDLAVLGQADRVACGASSVGCRLLGVMMGWDKAIKKKQWRNVDGQFDWKGIVW